MDEGLFLRDEQGKWLLEAESTPGEDAEKTIEMMTKGIDQWSANSLVNRAKYQQLTQAVVFCGRATLKGPKSRMWLASRSLLTTGLDYDIKRQLWVKCYQTVSHATEKPFIKGRVHRGGRLHCCLILRNFHSHPNLQQPPPTSVSSHQHQQNDYGLKANDKKATKDLDDGEWKALPPPQPSAHFPSEPELIATCHFLSDL
ncbi:hypothetical protein QTO34_011501 [Cnephaeus nilssonii]|uniref:Uncharacterized protein n=1 Tax=Cnephaeus nilssonii TaxID=3371016 RepID=A0AA40HDM1_CNENI|nr:hypothetical protein QTO34_011501 [Eptesicus nilssonii]